jgi:hypothetical protein
MPITFSQMSAPPECQGEQWTVHDIDSLAELVSIVLIGRAFHASEILDGIQPPGAGPIVADALKAELQKELHPKSKQTIWHRDGLLFEVICWVAAKLSATPNEVISDPHLKATNQGTDCVRVRIDPIQRTLELATVYEYKCTENWRQLFASKVLDAFQEYISGKRDNQLSQATIALLKTIGFNRAELHAAYDRLIMVRPLVFQAALTVMPVGFTPEQRLTLFGGYDTLGGTVETRVGDTFPLDDIRVWFDDFSAQVWSKIDV